MIMTADSRGPDQSRAKRKYAFGHARKKKGKIRRRGSEGTFALDAAHINYALEQLPHKKVENMQHLTNR